MIDIVDLLDQLTPSMGWRALTAFVLCAVLIPLSLPLARRFGLVDRPGGRKLHDVATPVTGGLCILIAVVAVGLLFDPLPKLRLPVFFTCIGLLVAVGAWDDLRDISWRLRLLVQVGVAVLMAKWAGLQVQNLHDVFGIDTLGLLALPFTIFVVVGVINALNMADGVDGLAGGQAIVSLLLFAAFALYSGDLLAVQRLLTISAAVAGFLLWNSRFPWQPRARVFL
ncbi:MAG TPA: MraY family glycosyltransferase, partial [Arenimonas sp.]|nr:MraY family glycosyltransferase [Arenimonas sp.]